MLLGPVASDRTSESAAELANVVILGFEAMELTGQLLNFSPWLCALFDAQT